MDLNTISFLMFGFLFVGFLVLEGFAYGVGILLPFLGRSDIERQAIIHTLAPVWEGNEVWLIAAGTVLFAAFPHVYATLFSGLYLALLLILIALILRGVAFEFRSKDENWKWRSFWDWTIFCGGIIPALLWGIAVANLLCGLPINGERQYSGTFGDLLKPYALTGGLVFVFIFLLHGAAYLTLRLEPYFILRARKTGLRAGKYALFIVVSFAVLTFAYTDLAAKPIAGGLLAASVMALALCCRCLRKCQYIKSFVFSTITIVTITGAIFLGLFPRFIVSSLHPDWSLNIYNSAANPLTLKIMTGTMAIVLPVILVFEGWKYYIFREKISVAELRFGLRKKLWGQLCERLKELIGHINNLSIILEKAQYTLERKQSLQPKEKPPMASQSHEFITLIQYARRLAGIFAGMIKILKKP